MTETKIAIQNAILRPHSGKKLQYGNSCICLMNSSAVCTSKSILFLMKCFACESLVTTTVNVK